jgi:bifunctional ADP-heptose synthase (sugar kinase/adenylyltransferase)
MSERLTDAVVEQVLQRLPSLTIGVVGDLFLDRYLDLDAALTEPSLETGLDAYRVVRVRSYPGAAGTVMNNLVALGVGRVVPVAVIGDDGEGYELRQAVRACLESPTFVRSSAKEPDVHLYYVPNERVYLSVVTAPADRDERFVVTA